jgi:hypothetical protein
LTICQNSYRSSGTGHLFSPPPLEKFKRDGVVIFEDKRKSSSHPATFDLAGQHGLEFCSSAFCFVSDLDIPATKSSLYAVVKKSAGRGDRIFGG